MDSLEDRLERSAEAWKPNPGDTLIGEVVDVAAHDGGYGDYPVVTVRTDNGGEVVIHAFHTVLKREFLKLRPTVGSRLGVKYLGRHERGYENYKIVRDEPSPPVDWDSMTAQSAAAGEAEQPPPIDDAQADGIAAEQAEKEAEVDEIPF